MPARTSYLTGVLMPRNGTKIDGDGALEEEGEKKEKTRLLFLVVSIDVNELTPRETNSFLDSSAYRNGMRLFSSLLVLRWR